MNRQVLEVLCLHCSIQFTGNQRAYQGSRAYVWIQTTKFLEVRQLPIQGFTSSCSGRELSFANFILDHLKRNQIFYLPSAGSVNNLSFLTVKRVSAWLDIPSKPKVSRRSVNELIPAWFGVSLNWHQHDLPCQWINISMIWSVNALISAWYGVSTNWYQHDLEFQ